MQKRKIHVLFLIGLMAFGLTACQTSDNKTKTKEKEIVSEEKASSEPELETPEPTPEIISYEINTGEVISIAEQFEAPSFQSSDDTIATVTEDGQVQGIKKGEVTIAVTDGENQYEVPVRVKKRGMVYPNFTMFQKQHLDLQFSSKDEVTDFTWTSDDPTIAKVTKKGQVKAKKTGQTVIRGVSDEHTYVCYVTVEKKPEKKIYLTFDDGPNRYSTTKILDILKKHDVKATFFELKPAKKDYDLTQRVIDEGHTLAMHGYQHKYDKIYQSVEIYRENLDKLRNLFFKNFGVWCTVTRFPGGSSNTVSKYNPGIMTEITSQIHDWGYHYYDWSVSSGDAGGAKTSDDVFRNFKRELTETGGNVVLMHDFANNDKTIDALDRIIEYGKEHGYTFLPITASTDEVHHRVNN